MLRRKYFAQRGTNIQTKTKGKSTLTRMNNFRRNIHPDCTNCTSGNSGAIIKNIVHHDSSHHTHKLTLINTPVKTNRAHAAGTQTSTYNKGIMLDGKFCPQIGQVQETASNTKSVCSSSSTSSAGAGNASIRLDKIKRCTDLHKDNSDTNTVRDLNYDDYIKQKKACLVFNSHTYIKDPNKCLN
jgi:hypothetical protein